MPLPNAFDNDHGNVIFRRITLPILIVLIPLVIFMQQFLRTSGELTLEKAPPDVAAREEPEEPGFDPVSFGSKVIVKRLYFEQSTSESQRSSPEEMIASLDETAASRVERLRAAIVAGDVLGPQAALDRLTTLDKEVARPGDLATEVTWLKQYYAAAVAKQTPALPADVQTALIARHGWFGELALTLGRHASDPARFALVSGYDQLDTTESALTILHVVISLVGFFVCIYWLINVGRGGIELDMGGISAPHGVFLEMFTVWAAAFFILVTAGILTLGTTSIAGLFITEILSWSVTAAVAWPLLRGVQWKELCANLGLHTGQGVLKEIGCGIVGFLAAQPLLWIGLWIANLLAIVLGSQESENQGFPLFDGPHVGGWPIVFLDALGACVWAPLVEETFFRGALYAWLRVHLAWMPAALVSAAIFGAIHPYSPLGIIPVAFSGISFALMREWRGSLIAPMTAHALHNGLITVSTIIPLSLLE